MTETNFQRLDPPVVSKRLQSETKSDKIASNTERRETDIALRRELITAISPMIKRVRHIEEEHGLKPAKL